MEEGSFIVSFTVRVVGNGRNDGFCLTGDQLNLISDIGNAYGDHFVATSSFDAAIARYI